MKAVTLSREVQGYNPQEYFDALYADGSACVPRYHREVNHSEDVQLTPWEGGQRVVVFMLHIEAPAFLKRIVGVDNAKVMETQNVEFRPDGSVMMVSVPVPSIPGGDKFSTRVETLVTCTPSGCLVNATAFCSAAGPYGLTGTIEGFMAEQAKDGLNKWMDFTDAFLAEAAARPAVAPPAAAVEGVEEFFDAEELPAEAAEQAAPAATAASLALPALPAAAAPPTGELVPSAPLTFEDSVLLYLRYMCRTGDQSCVLIEALDRRLASLERDMAVIRAAVVLLEEDSSTSSTTGQNGPASRPASNGSSMPRWQGAVQQQGRRQNGAQVQQQPAAAAATVQQGRPLLQAQAVSQSVWCQPVSLRKALIGAGLLATASAAATALFFRRQQARAG